MKHFTIENETNKHHDSRHSEGSRCGPNAERFSNEAALAKLAGDWPTARLVEIWNSLPGEAPVKKFKDRATAASRIWKAIQNLGQSAPAAEETRPRKKRLPPRRFPRPKRKLCSPANPPIPRSLLHKVPDVTPAEAPAKKKPTREKKVPKTTEPGSPREGSKISQVIEMLKREGGTTLEEIMTAMGWQKHTMRAMLSAGGSLTKKHRLTVISEKIGERRVYSIKA
jgi:hypothetical protein